MEVRLTAELETRLNELAAATGRPTDELVQDAMAGYLDELTDVRSVLDRRYHDLKSGRVAPVDGEQVFERLRTKSEARRNSGR